MSLSLTKETGWSDGGQGDGKKKSRGGRRGQICSGAPHHHPNPALHTSPSKSLLDSRKKRNIVVAHFSSVKLYDLVISLSRCGLCSEGSLHIALVRLSSVPREVFCIHSFLHNHDLVSVGFLVMKSLMFTIVTHENNFFKEPLVFVSYLYIDIKKGKNEGMLHLS